MQTGTALSGGVTTHEPESCFQQGTPPEALRENAESLGNRCFSYEEEGDRTLVLSPVVCSGA